MCFLFLNFFSLCLDTLFWFQKDYTELIPNSPLVSILISQQAAVSVGVRIGRSLLT